MATADPTTEIGAEEGVEGGALKSGEAAKPGAEPLREVSAATVGRMLGLATVSELKLLEGKLDLVSTRMQNMTIRLDKVLTMLSSAPTGSDLERIDVQIASLRTLIKESMVTLTEGKDGGEAPKKRLSSSIRSASAAESASTKATEASEEEVEE